MKEYKYKILNPGGNKTALVIGDEYSIEEKKTINNEILNDNKDVEQVAFISKTEKKLDMAGGEFCINATRCAIYEYLNEKNGKIKMSSSGKKLLGGIKDKKEVYVEIPINKRKNEIIVQKSNYNIINLDGIVLMIFNEIDSKKYINMLKKNENDAKIKLKSIMNEIKTKEKAIGVILLEKLNITKIHPIIWVKDINTIYYETACGSGSLAGAIYLNNITGITKFKILQPSNYVINVELNVKNDYLITGIISGKVESKF